MPAVRRLLVFLAGVVAATALTIFMIKIGPGWADLPSGLPAVPDWVEADPEHALTTVVGLAAWACLLWLCAGLILGALAALPGTGGRAAATIARRVLPRALRHIVEVAVGITLAAGSAAPALAVSPAAVTGSATVTAAVPSTAWPDLDPRDLSPTPTVPPSASPSSTTPAVTTPTGSPGPSTRSSSPEPTRSPADASAATPARPTSPVPQAATPPPANSTNPASPPAQSTQVPGPTPVISMSLGVQASWPDLSPQDTQPNDPLVAPAPRGIGAPGQSLPPSRGTQVQDSAEIVVLHGDTLWTIAARHLGADATVEQIAQEWPRWWAANKHVIGPDPDRILPGQHLQPPRPRP